MSDRPLVEISPAWEGAPVDSCRITANGKEAGRIVRFSLAADANLGDRPPTLRLEFLDDKAPNRPVAGLCNLRIEIPVWVEPVLTSAPLPIKVEPYAGAGEQIYKEVYRILKRAAEEDPRHRPLLEAMPDPLARRKAKV